MLRIHLLLGVFSAASRQGSSSQVMQKFIKSTCEELRPLVRPSEEVFAPGVFDEALKRLMEQKKLVLVLLCTSRQE